MDYNLSTTWTIVLIVWALWELLWKGFALWHAGRNDHRNWFVALMVVNSVGLLPMLYLLLNYTGSNTEKKDAYHGKTAIPFEG